MDKDILIVVDYCTEVEKVQHLKLPNLIICEYTDLERKVRGHRFKLALLLDWNQIKNMHMSMWQVEKVERVIESLRSHGTLVID